MNMPGNQITHINYGFVNIGSDCRVVVGDSWADTDKAFDGDTWDQPLRGNFNQLIKFKAKYPHIKTAISIGGWTWSTMFPTCASS
jgi:chitinase